MTQVENNLDLSDAIADLRRRMIGLHDLVCQMTESIQMPNMTDSRWERFCVYDRLVTDVFERTLHDIALIENSLQID